MVTDTQVKTGYKQSELGVIPSDWEYTNLGLVCSYKNGKSFESNIDKNGNFNLITLDSIDITGKLKKDHLKVKTNDNSLGKNDIIMILSDVAHGNFLGLTDVIPEDNRYVLNQRVGALKNIKEFLPHYLSRYINLHQKYFKRVGQGSNQQNLAKGDVLAFPVLKPSLSEQEKIMDVLSNIEKLVEKTDQLIEKKRNIKQGTMQELLTGKRRLPGFSGAWEEINLGEICGKITTGKLDANAMVENGEYIFYTCAKEYYFIDRYAFDDEALLVSGNGANVGYIHYYKGKFNAYQRTYVLTDFKSNIHYVKVYMDVYLRDRIQKEVNAGNTPYIKMDTLTNMKIKLPPTKDEQAAIANVLDNMDQELELLENQKNKYLDMKQGMMQQLLTGRIRLV